MLKKTTISLLILYLLICLSGCRITIDNPGTRGTNVTKRMDKEVDLVTVKITETEIQENGVFYTLKLKNGSSHLVKQNTVYLSPYDSITNSCKVEAAGNKLDIKPNEEVMLFAAIPNECFKNNPKIDSQHPSLEINGYFDEVTPLTHFMKCGSGPNL